MCNFVKLNRTCQCSKLTKFLKQGLKAQEDDGAVCGGWAIVSRACVRSGAAAGQLCPAWGQLRPQTRDRGERVAGDCVWALLPYLVRKSSDPPPLWT